MIKQTAIKFLVLAVLISIPFLSKSQQALPDSIYQVVDTMPAFAGGQTELMKFLQRNLRYPPEAREQGIQGRVVAQFVVEKDGSINDLKIIQSVGGGCDEEVIRIIRSMPPWKAGRKNGVPVRVIFKLPVTFKLGEESSLPSSWSPYYKGGPKELDKFIRKNLVYPAAAKKAKVKGEVIVSFTVDEFGKPQNAKVVQSLSPECDEEALRIVRLMPSWIPGRENNINAPKEASITVKFGK